MAALGRPAAEGGDPTDDYAAEDRNGGGEGGEDERVLEGVDDDRAGGERAGNRPPQIAVERARQPGPELHDDGLVQPELAGQGRPVLGRRGRPQQRSERIARRELQRGES